MVYAFIPRATKLAWIVTLAASVNGCGSPDTPTPDDTQTPHDNPQPDDKARGVITLQGVWETPPFLTYALTERYAALTDMTAFVERDPGLFLPDNQLTTRLVAMDDGDESFRLALPQVPYESTRSVEDRQVAVFALSVLPNLAGDPFTSPIEMTGWATVFTSVDIEPGSNEVTAGRLIVWTADESSEFPSGFGDDGLLFTNDDPLAPLPAGWTVVDLDSEPFRYERESAAEIPIINGDFGRDFSALGFAGAFDAVTTELALRYPFTDIKDVDWPGLTAELRPLVVEAEENDDPIAFFEAMRRLSLATRDGHVAVDPLPTEVLLDRYGAGIGLRLGQTTGGDVIVTDVADGSPAFESGIAPGAQLLTWNGEPLSAALAATELFTAESSPHGTMIQQLKLLPRMPSGSDVTLSYENPDDDEAREAQLTAVDNVEGLIAAFGGEGNGPLMPVSVSVLPSGIGYIVVNTFFDDATLMTHAWEWSLQHLLGAEVPALIVDVRQNGGGLDQLGAYFAGSFTTEPFVRSRSFAHDSKGSLVAGAENVIRPAPVQWNRPVAVLVDAGCRSTCEEFTAAMATNPEHLIVGTTPTGGVEAEVSLWILPGEMIFQAPLGMFRYLDGELFVEGKGIAPNLLVPVTRKTLLSPEDAVLTAAETALGAQLDAG